MNHLLLILAVSLLPTALPADNPRHASANIPTAQRHQSSDMRIGTGEEKIKASGRLITQERPIGTFDGVESSSAIQVIVSDRPDSTLTVEADDNILPYVRTEVHGSTLRIDYDTEGRTLVGPTVRITLPDNGTWRSLKASSASTIRIDHMLEGDTIDLDASSAGHITWSGIFREVRITASSAARIDACMQCEHLTADAASTGRITLDGFADQADLKASSAAEISTSLQSKKCLAAEAASTSRITLDGFADQADLKASSAAEISTSLQSKRLAAEASSTGRITLDGFADRVELKAASAAKIRSRLQSKELTARASSTAKIDLSGKSDTADLAASSAGRIDAGGLKTDRMERHAGSGGSVYTR